MKRYLIKIALFFAIVAVVDFGFGKVCDYLRDHTKGGFSGNIHYICEESNEDIIMMGSSRMRHHYVPQVFEDSLGMTCYNAGIDGNGIITAYGFLEMILQRYTPKLIIYDVHGFDMYTDDNTKYLASLKEYYHKADIPDIFHSVKPAECWKMKSSLYRYNSSFLGLLGDNLHPLKSFENGYWPSSKVMDYEPEKPKAEFRDVDSLKLQYVEKFIDLARKHDVELVFCASPTYFGDILQNYNYPVKDICVRKEVPFIDDYYDVDMNSSKKNWSDATHLNDIGARVYSKKLTSIIKELF